MRTLLIVCGAIFSALIMGCAKDSFDFSQSNSKIVFISQRIENSSEWNLYRMNSDGSNQEKISDLTVRCEKPVVSHSGKTILFIHMSNSFYELYSMKIDGSDLMLIDKSHRYCGLPDWSDDDTKIVYSKNRNELSDDLDLLLYDFKTHTTDTLTYTGTNASAKFTPDDRIIYCHQINDIPAAIYFMNLDGSDKQMIIPKAGNPVLSPDKKKITYQSTIGNRSTQIFVADLNGKNQIQLTNSYSPRIWPGWPPDGNYDSHWTPDSKKIVYVSWEDEDPEIHIMNSDGSGKLKLTDNEMRDEYPEISSDGKFILFTSKSILDMDAEIFVMAIDGKNQKSLSNYKGADIYPVEIN